ncbi:protein BatD [Flavobacterium sp. NST-5]|uniref:Protein BatD n=2 Tax=Flavobacterium ichthyis TaxID=2698827 RepID=A0ABW9Z965_9FLAO|nr:BatD family protein [Flavobacterium ichthyis]NBL65417.1 protein BatD [Flavobacterium ichthyis]
MRNFFTALFITFFATLSAQVQFEARVNKQSVAQNERFRIEFAMNEDGDNFVPPSFEGFRIVGGPSQQVSQSWINGKASFQKSYIYILLPTQKGNLTIKQASIEIHGQIYKTSPVKINVTNAVEQPQDPYANPYGNPYGNPYQQQQQQQYQPPADGGIHLVAEISNENPYVNQPITVVYKLYVSHNSSVRNWRELQSPKFNDFWSQNIDIKNLVVEEGKFKGENYRYVVLRKTVLYPQKSGKLTIEPLSLDIAIDQPTGKRDIFGRPHFVPTNKTVSAGKRSINVRSLPENGKPEDFGGAVGKFNFVVKPSKTELKHGETLELEVSVSGNGNLKLFNLPKPIVPSAFEMYDPVHNEQVSTPLSGMQGKISDKYTIVPQFQGDYTIKGLTFSYFDLSSNSYKTITSNDVNVKVLDGPIAGNDVANTSESAEKKAVKTVNQFKFIALKTNLINITSEDFLGSPLFYGLMIVPFLLIPIIILARKKKEAIDSDIVGNKRRLSSRLAKKYLAEARKQIANKEAFYIALEKALHNFLKAKLHIETSEMSKEKIREILLEKNAKPETIEDFINLSESCEFARYAPSSSTAIQEDYERAGSIISELEKQIS